MYEQIWGLRFRGLSRIMKHQMEKTMEQLRDKWRRGSICGF